MSDCEGWDRIQRIPRFKDRALSFTRRQTRPAKLLRELRAAVLESTKAGLRETDARCRLQSACGHPLVDIKIESWSDTDTLGGHRGICYRLFCSLCLTTLSRWDE